MLVNFILLSIFQIFDSEVSLKDVSKLFYILFFSQFFGFMFLYLEHITVRTGHIASVQELHGIAGSYWAAWGVCQHCIIKLSHMMCEILQGI